ncbi:hypothetical protein OIU84_014798 [Salix udensis]|uniref:Uncharacterized protein n=1 Tax=Salix udensis TaxID=889485 RepID=A0AAD6JCT9_9ROSI|nr:hypothetical protein OIU84_014798 [Salix udensis]
MKWAPKRQQVSMTPVMPCLSTLFSVYFCGKDPSKTKLGSEGPAAVDKWLVLQLAPLATLGFPKFLKHFEDLLIHTFPIPFFPVKSDYKKLYDAFYASSGSVLDKAESLGIDRDEACHNLVFIAGFNAYGGMKAWFPTLIKWVGQAGEKLHSQLANEIRTVVKEEGWGLFPSPGEDDVDQISSL